LKKSVDTNEVLPYKYLVSGNKPNDKPTKIMTTEQIKALSDTEFWDILEDLAEEESQSPEFLADISELRRFQKEADRRTEGARKAFAAKRDAEWAAKAANDPCPF